MAKRGRPVTNVEPMRQLNVWTTAELVAELDAACEADSLQRKDVLVKIITNYLARRTRRLAKGTQGGNGHGRQTATDQPTE